MRYYYKTLFGVLISGVLCLHTAQADSVPIAGTTAHNGHITQGGLLTLTLSKGASATLDETPLMISAHGHIAFGFHRDDEATQHLIITTSDGTRHHTALTPSARRYKTQSITGLAGKYVTPPQETLARIAADREAVIVARSHQTVQDDFITGGFDWPLIGTITGIYGSQRILNGKPRAPHYGAGAEINIRDNIIFHSCADIDRLGFHLAHQPRALHHISKTWEIFDICRNRQLPTRLKAGIDYRLHVRTRSVNRRCITSRTGTNNYDFFMRIRHQTSYQMGR